MLKTNSIISLVIALIISGPLNAQYSYPLTKEIPVTDDYFGTKITDNYRWLEDLNNSNVQSWFKSQSVFADSVLEKINGREMLLKRMKEFQLMGGDIIGKTIQAENTYFYVKTKKNENLSKLYLRNSPDGVEQLLFDPEAYQKGTQLINFAVDEAGTKIAMALSKSGAEVSDIYFLDVSSKKLLDEKVGPVWSGFSFEFTNHATELLYTRMNSYDNTSDELLKNMKVFIHVIGTPLTNDRVIVSKEHDKELNMLSEQIPMVNISDDKKYIFLILGSVQSELLSYFAKASELYNSKIDWIPLTRHEDEITETYTIGNKLYFLTHKNAPNFKIGVTDLDHIDYTNAKIIVPESKEVIRSLQKSKNFLYYSLSNGINQFKYQINPIDNTISKLPLPDGINGSMPLNPAQNDNLLVFNTSWLVPYTTFEYNGQTAAIKKSQWVDVSGNYPDYKKEYMVSEVEVKSYDGTMVPLSIIYSKNIVLDGSTPCYLSGYGAYGESIQPNFIDVMATFLEQGGCIAFAHVRGGGEKGDTWHQAGMKNTKPNTWKDFIACAEYLITNKYTSPNKLIGNGMSAGGILIGRAITERPDLFAVAIAEVGMTNTLRSETSPNGDNQIPEIGSIKNKSDIKALIEMDTQSKIKKGVKYPAVFVRSGMNDPRVSPWMPGKFAASLQNATQSGKPVLLYVNYNNGHFTSDMDVFYKELSDMLSFSLWQVGHPSFTSKNNR